jgi:enamine deaminase RidA (YjgF/YER057c/UK114 family)
MTSTVEDRLAALGLSLPERCDPRGNFLPFERAGSLVFMAGQICEWNGGVPFTGPVRGGDETADEAETSLSLEEGRRAAEICALNLLFHLRSACDGDLDRVTSVVRVGGFVNCRFGFDKSPAVINGASDLLIALYGDAGRHARTAVGVAGLPANASVEVDAVFEIA